MWIFFRARELCGG